MGGYNLKPGEEKQVYGGTLPVMDVMATAGKTTFTSLDGDGTFVVQGEYLDYDTLIAIKRAYTFGLEHGRQQGKAKLQAEIRRNLGCQ